MEIDEISTTTGAMDQDETIALMQAQIDIQQEKINQLVTTTDQLRSQIQELLQWKETAIANQGTVSAPKKEVQNNASTDWTSERTTGSTSIADMVKEAAEQEVAKQEQAMSVGFCVHGETGWYFDAQSGYYFEPNTKLTYSPPDRKYYTYDATRGEYKLYSTSKAERKLAEVSNWHPEPKIRAEMQERRHADNYKRNRISNSTRKGAAKKAKPTMTEDKGVKRNGKEVKHRSAKRKKSVEEKIKVEKENLETEEIEDGELSSSEASDSNTHGESDHSSDEGPSSCAAKSTSTIRSSEDEESEEEQAPCIRAVVVNSAAPDLKPGALFIITCMGGTIGREGGQHAVLISDSSMSKNHATITYEFETPENENECRRTRRYFIADCGSENGTFLNGNQVSDTKCTIVHGSTLKVGDTTLLLHIHPGLQTCGHCEPGLLLQEEQAVVVHGPILSKNQKDALRRKELRKLRKKFGVDGDATAALAKLPGAYKDRAEDRRVTKGSDNPFEKTQVASIDEPIQETNKGYALMKKMGWSDGAALGQAGQEGIKEPIKFEIRSGRTGLGAQAQFPGTASVSGEVNLSATSLRRGKNPSRNPEVLAAVRKRYEAAQSPSDDAAAQDKTE